MKRAVVDQAGLRVVIIGVVLSLFVGLIFRSQIRSTVVKAKLQQSLVKLQKDMNINFESAEVRLSDWGIPRPVIEIRGIRISPLKINCQENQIYIDNLSFPLSFNLLFSKNKVISTVRISLLELRVKNTRQCFSKSANSEKESTPSFAMSTSQSYQQKNDTNPAIESLKKVKSHLDEIKIDRLRLLAVDKMNSAVDFNAVQVLFKYDQDRLAELSLQSQLSAFKEADKSYYLFKSDLKILAKLDEKPTITADLKGLIVDRPFQLRVKNDLQKNSVQFLGEVNGVSLKAINYIVKVERPNTDVYDFLNGSSMSGFLTGEYNISERKYEANFKDIKILLAGGLAEINDIFVLGASDAKAQIKPFDLQLSHIELTKFLSHKAFDNIRPSIQNAGFISGLIQFTDFNNFKVKSLIEKTSFVFSNKGQRVTQVFDSFNLHANIDSQKLNLNINDFILDSQKIYGFIKFNQNNESGDKNLSVDLEGRLLSPDTVKLFSGQNSDPKIKLLFTSDLKNNLKGSAFIDKINFHQYEMTKLNLDYEKNLLLKSELYNIRTGQLAIAVNDSVLDQILPGPSVTFAQSKLQIQKDDQGKLFFNFRGEQKGKSELTVTGDYTSNPSEMNAKGFYKNTSFNITGPLDNLKAIQLK